MGAELRMEMTYFVKGASSVVLSVSTSGTETTKVKSFILSFKTGHCFSIFLFFFRCLFSFLFLSLCLLLVVLLEGVVASASTHAQEEGDPHDDQEGEKRREEKSERKEKEDGGRRCLFNLEEGQSVEGARGQRGRKAMPKGVRERRNVWTRKRREERKNNKEQEEDYWLESRVMTLAQNFWPLQRS